MDAFSGEVKKDLEKWHLDLQADRYNAKAKNDLIRFGGENQEKKKWEGRKVGIDFFRGQKGPPDDLRKEKDEFPGRFGLAGEYAGDRNLANPYAWYAEWVDMGIPPEMRIALEREEASGNGGRVIRGNKVLPRVKAEGEEAEEDRLRREEAVERAKLMADRLAAVVRFDDMGNEVLAGRIRWVRNKDGR